MLLFLVRLALALQSLDGCQDLIKLITAVSQCRGFGTPNPRLLPTSLLHPKDPAGKERRESSALTKNGPTLPFYFRAWVQEKQACIKMWLLFSILCQLYFLIDHL